MRKTGDEGERSSAVERRSRGPSVRCLWPRAAATRGVVLRACTVALALLVVPRAAPSLLAQGRSGPEEAGASCRTCVLRSRDVVELSMPADGVPSGVPLHVRRDGRGRYWVFYQDQATPALFDAAGRFVQLVGRKGSGPGEYRAAVDMLAVPGDSVVIIDPGLRRYTVLNGDLRPVRFVNAAAPVVELEVIRWPDRLLGSGPEMTADGAGYQIQEVTLAGNVLEVRARFTVTHGDTGPDDWIHQRYILWKGDGGAFWAAWTSGHDIYRFERASTPVRHFQQRPIWQGRVPATLGAPDRPPSAFTKGLFMPTRDFLVVVLAKPKSSWQRAWPASRPGVYEVPASAMDLSEMYSGVAEAVSAHTGSVQAIAEWPELPISMVERSTAAFYFKDSRGERIVVRAIELDGVPTR